MDEDLAILQADMQIRRDACKDARAFSSYLCTNFLQTFEEYEITVSEPSLISPRDYAEYLALYLISD